MSPARRRASAAADRALRRPIAPMFAAPVDVVPEGPDLVHEPKWDGWRAIVIRENDGVHVQSRSGRNLTPYFPDIADAVRGAVPPGTVLDGELIVWRRGRTSFDQLQRRVTAGRGLPRVVRECPAHLVLFDLLADAGGEVVLDLPLSRRRARLERLLVGAPAPLTLTPQTADPRQVSDWLTHWTVAAGIEGVVTKRLAGPYQPGHRGWWKYRTHLTTEAIVGGVTGGLRDPETLLLGRLDRGGRLRYTGRTHPLDPRQRAELAGLLAAPRPSDRPGATAAHPWPEPLPASWSGQLDRPEPLPYVRVEPTVVVEIHADVAFEHHRWRHRVRYARPRPDMPADDVPLLLGEEPGYFEEG